MKKLLTIALMISLAICSFGQKGKSFQNRGNIQYESFNFKKAAALYSKAIDKNPELYYSMEQLGNCYRMLNKWQKAEEVYSQLVKIPGAKPEFYYYYAQSLRSNQKYDMAMTYFEEYAEMVNDPAYTTSLKYDMADIETMMSAESRYTVRNLSEVNSAGDEFGPMFYNDGLIFSSNREDDVFVGNMDLWTQAPFLGLYVADADENGMLTGSVEPLEGKINGKFHDGPVTFSNDGNIMYLTRSNYTRKKPGKGADKTVGLKIFMLTKNEEGVWGNIGTDFPANGEDHSVAHAALSPNGDFIVFTSDMNEEGMQGGSDLYICEKVGTGWGEPRNLGPMVNTLGDEMFPYIANDGSLYFASNGHPGLGGLDIFVAEKKGDTWANPTNLGAPVNTSSDDFNMIVSENGLFGYFASNRAGGAGGDDLYYCDIEPIGDIELIVTVYASLPNEDKKEILPNSKVVLTNLYTNEKETAMTDASGKVSFIVDREQQYVLEGSHAPISERRQYLSTTKKTSTVGVIPPAIIEEELVLLLTEKDVPIELENIYYDLDKWFIREDAKPDLDFLVKTMNDNPTMTIELASHTDCRASKEYNLELSAKRAESAAIYIIKSGISGKRILAAGYGESKPVNDCACEGGVGKGRTDDCTDDMHQDNRRTEFTILSY